ncbi:MAG: putative glycoside hydrolase, partial [Sulfurimonas sp.]
DYAHRKIEYSYFEINEQIRAAADANTSGWMLWSPSSRYEISYFTQREKKALTFDLVRETQEYID